MHEIGSLLERNSESVADQILKEWFRLAQQEPWHRLPPSLDLDHLPSLIKQLSKAALITFFGTEERVELADLAAQHGLHRFNMGVAEEMLAREYELLRWGLWTWLKANAPSERASEAIIRLDSAMTFSLGATLRGYHSTIIKESGDWPAALARYVEQWSFPAR